MTLVAARRVRDAIAVTADWRVTDPTTRPSYQTGTLKVVILSPEVLCAYSGGVDTALCAIRKAREVVSNDEPGLTDRVIEPLAEASAGGDCDFIVAQCGPRPEIVRIKGGNEQRRMIDGGSFRTKVCPAESAGVGALALLFPDQRLSVFTYPMLLGADTVTYRDLSGHQMAERVLADYGVVLDLSMVMPEE